MKVGDYVRTKKGIAKIIGKLDDMRMSYPEAWVTDTFLEIYDDTEYIYDEAIIKSSPNIIDLIEVGDYVNGLPVECVEGTWDDENDKRVYYGVATYGHKSNLPYHTYIVKDEFENDYDLKFRCIKPNEIKSIVTKEQFESMEYKVGE